MSDIYSAEFIDAGVRNSLNRSRAAGAAAATDIEGNPDEAARAQQLSLETGVPASVIHGDLENFEKTYKGNLNRQIVENDPILQEYINSNPMAVKVSHNDFHNLAEASDTIKGIAKQLAPDTPERIQQEREKFDAFFEGSGRFRWPWQIAEWIKPEDAEKYPRLSMLASYSGWGLETALKGLSGVGHMVPAAFKDALLQEGVEEGTANYYANTLGGFIEWKMTDMASHGGPKAEGVRARTEPLTPEKILPELEKMSEAVQAARPWLENGQPIPRGVHEFWDKEIERASKEELKQLEDGAKAIDKTDTKELSPSLTTAFVRQHVGDRKIEIDAAAARKLYGDDIPTEGDGKLGWIPNLREQLEAAELHGGSIEAPLAEWYANSTPELREALKEDIRSSHQGMTLNEAEKFKEQREKLAEQEKEEPKVEGEEPKVEQPPTHIEAVRKVAGVEKPLFDPQTERIVSAAIKLNDGRVFTGAHHVEAMENAKAALGRASIIDDIATTDEGMGGFITSTGRLIGRDEAQEIARGAGQLARDHAQGAGIRLTAEDIKKGELAEVQSTNLEKPAFGKMALGMNKRWMENYSKLMDRESEDLAKARLAAAEKQERREQTDAWKYNRNRIEEEVRNDIQGRPDIAVGTFFESGELFGQKIREKPVLDTTKLSPEQKELLPKVTYGRGGVNPDDLAGAFGLRSGDELVQILAQMQSAKGEGSFKEFVRQITKKEVDRRMQQEYGNLEENIMNEAMEHALGTSTMDRLHQEIVGLGTELGQELPITKSDFLAQAKLKFDNTPVGQITVPKMLRDALKHSTDAELALLDEKPTEAFVAKQAHYMSLLMAKEAAKLEKQRGAAEKLWKRLAVREQKSILPEYINYIHQILMQIGRPVRRSIQDLQEAIQRSGYGDLAGFVQAKEGALREMPVAEFLFNSSFKKQTADMTVGEYRAVMNSIKTLVHNGRDEMTMEVEGAKRDLNDVLTEMKEKLEALSKDKAPRIDRPQSEAIRTIKTYWASSLTTESLLNRWDKDDPRGIFNRYIVYPMAEAANHEAKLIREYQATLREAAGDIKDIDKLVPNDLWNDPLGGGFFQMRKRNVLGILQNIGNRSNLEKLAKGYGLEPDQVIQWVIQNTTKEDWDRAQRIGDVFAKLSEMADTMAEGISGVTFEKLPIESLQTPYGQYRGWYNPIKYDPNRPGRSKRLIGPNALEEEGYFRATTPQGYTKGRTGYIAPVELNLDVVPMRIKQMIHDIAFRPAVLQTSKVFYDSEFQRSVIKNYGEVYAKQLVPFLKDVANYSNNMGGSDAAGVFNRAVEYFRQNLIATLVGFNPHTVMKHGMTAAVNSLTEVGPVNFMRELSGLMMNSEVSGKNNWQFAMEHSEELQRRMRNWSELIQGQPEVSLMRASPRQFLISAGSTPIAVGDLLSAVPTWLARYRTAIEEGIDHGQAVAEGNRAVRRAHGSSAITNRAQIMRSNALGATFSSLYGFFSHMLNKQFELAWKAADSFQGLKAGDLSAAKQHTPALIMGLVSYVIFPAVVEELVTPYTNSDRDSWGMKAAKTMAKGISSSFIGVRDFVDGFINTREGGAGLIPTAFKSIYDISRDLGKGKKVMNKEEAGRTIKHTFTAVGTLSGLTNAQEGRTAEFLYHYHQGLEHPKGFMDWSRGLTRGTLKEYRR